MNLQRVKTPEGRRLRHPRDGRVLPSTADPGDGLRVDLDEPHWHRALVRGDIVVVEAAPATVQAGTSAAVKPVANLTTTPAASSSTANTNGGAA